MKNIIEYLTEAKTNFLVKGHTKNQSIDISNLTEGPIKYKDIKIELQRNEKEHWEKFDCKQEMFSMITEILNYVKPGVIQSMSWYYGNKATLTLKKDNKQNIGWLSYSEKYKRMIFTDWELNIELYSDNKDGIEKIANEINKIGKK